MRVMNVRFLKGLGWLVMLVTAVVVFVQANTVAEAATITVSTTNDILDGADGQCSLREAVYAANQNAPFGGVAGECPAGSNTETDIITLANGGTYTLSIAGANEDVTASGDLDVVDNTAPLDVQFVVAGDGNATISANGIDRVLHILDARVELTNISLINGTQATGFGGNVYNQSGVLTMNGGEIRGGSAGTGGGLFNYSGGANNGLVTLNGTQVILNTADSGGGGIATIGELGTVTLNDVVVRANIASTADGGGIYVSGSTLVMNKGSVSLNEATGLGTSNGGGIYAGDSAVITITNALIEANETPTGSGGGIYLMDLDSDTVSDFTLRDSTIKDNMAGGNGGGLYSRADIVAGSIAPLVVENTSFSGNQADNGGGIYGRSVQITGGSFNDNVANNDGGATGGNIALRATDVTFTGNRANQGGAIETQILWATRIHVESNEATAEGGGAHISNSASEISASQFLSNTAGTDGGGLYAVNGGEFIRDSVFAYNQVGNNGGGVFVEDDAMAIGNSTISSNSATNGGGGLYIAATSWVTATNVTIALNTLGQDVHKFGDLTLQNSIIHTPDTPNCTVAGGNPNIISLGNNLTDDASCVGLDEPTDIVTPDVLLDPLADNGGNTLTHALQAGSPAINGGNAAACAGSQVGGVDQRGESRLEASCDIGAFEQLVKLFLPMIVK